MEPMHCWRCGNTMEMLEKRFDYITYMCPNCKAVCAVPLFKQDENNEGNN